MPEISIITPVHVDFLEKLQWLDETIESVLAQSFTDWEMIIVNDQSQLGLGEVKLKHTGESRIRWFDNANHSGPSATRNVAVALSESECLLPLDADDRLASPNVLASMYNEFSRDTTKIIFGNLTWLQLNPGADTYELGTTHNLSQYSFENAMNLDGIMPITAMHSKECHYRAGGWKVELEAGLEDVEYWLAAGKAGFCGQKINLVTLHYRRQRNSRAYKLRHVNQREYEMKKLIETMHADVYRGEYPMGCCGGKGSSNGSGGGSPMMQQVGKTSVPPTKLEGYPEDQLTWVQYVGDKKARFDILSIGNRPQYTIMGTGHKFQVRKVDTEYFRGAERGNGFLVNIPPPSLDEEIEDSHIQEPTVKREMFTPPEPTLSVIERFDGVAARSRGLNLPDASPSSVVPEVFIPPAELSLSDLFLGRLENVLASDGWTVDRIAQANVSDLTKYHGIGEVRANDIIFRARALMQEQG